MSCTERRKLNGSSLADLCQGFEDDIAPPDPDAFPGFTQLFALFTRDNQAGGAPDQLLFGYLVLPDFLALTPYTLCQFAQDLEAGAPGSLTAGVEAFSRTSIAVISWSYLNAHSRLPVGNANRCTYHKSNHWGSDSGQGEIVLQRPIFPFTGGLLNKGCGEVFECEVREAELLS